MKFIKTAIFITVLALAFAVSAKSSEEVCYDAVKNDLVLKQMILDNPSNLQGFLDHIEKGKHNPSLKAFMREKAFWVFNRKDVSEELFSKLSFLRCTYHVK